MKLIVGLGNPGLQYQYTRHNIGFMFLDYYAHLKNCTTSKLKFRGEYCEFTENEEKVILFKPLTYMNHSGEAIIQIVQFFHIPLENVIVIYDDMDLEFARLRLREKGNAGSHNGLKNIVLHLQSTSFKRVRVGIGRPEQISFMDYVLSKFSQKELEVLQEVFKDVSTAIDLFIQNKFLLAMNQFNIGREK